MPRTPKPTDGEPPKKRTRKVAPATESDTKVVKSKAVAPKNPKVKAAPIETLAASVAPAVPEKKSQPVQHVVTMASIEERIRIRAYELYLRRGGRGGSPEQDWFQATAEIYEESVA
jgi:hypothetical protein